MTISSSLAVIGGLLVVLTAVGALLAYLKANFAKSTIDVLNQNNTALEQRVEILEGDVLRLTADNTALRQENATLRTVVSAGEAITLLTAELRREAEERKHEHWDLGDLVTALQAAHSMEHREILEALRR